METLTWLYNYPSTFKYVQGEAFASNYTFPLTVGAGYLIVVFGLQWIMSKRPRFEARLLSVVHNFLMFAISVVAFIGITWGVVKQYTRFSPYEATEYLFCDEGRKETPNGTLYFWIYLFYLSKFYELIDTLLIVLRKGQLRFLHVYHHWVTMLLCIISLNTGISYQWAATGLNALVHIPMYYYYLMAVLKVNIWWKKYMTMFQIIQFLLDVAAAGSNVIWNFYFATPSCSSWEIPWANPIAIGIVLSYLFLFIEFFFKTYTTKPAAAGKGKPKDE